MFDCTPLTTPPTPAQLAELDTRNRAGEFGNGHYTGRSFVVAAILLALLGGGLMVLGRDLFVDLMRRGGIFYLGLLFPVLLVAHVVGLVVMGIRHTEVWPRVVLFGQTNGFRYHRRGEAPSYPWFLALARDERHIEEHLVACNPSIGTRLVEVGSLQTSKGWGDSGTEQTWGFAAYRLRRRFPRLVLDTADVGWLGSGLSAAEPEFVPLPMPQQLAHRFKRALTIRGHEQAALSLLAALTHVVTAQDPQWRFEVSEQWLFVYSYQALPLDDPSLWQQLQQVESTVVARLEAL